MAKQHKALKQSIVLERINTLYQGATILAFSAFVAAAITGLMLWSTRPHHIILTWIGLHLVVAICRGPLLHYFFKKHIHIFNHAVLWSRLYAGCAFLSGTLWGSLAWFLMDFSSSYNVSAIVIVMFGMVAASNVSLSVVPLAFFSFAIPTLGLLFVRLLLEGGHFTYVAILLLWFLAFNLVHAVRTSRLISHSIQQRFENDDLLHHLEVKKQEADKANLDKSRFLAATSHDLRQPLHALDLYLGVLEIKLTQPEHLNTLNLAKQSSHSVGELLNTLLDVSRLDAGEVAINIQDISLVTLFENLTSEWQPQLQEQGRSLRTFYHQSSIQTDPILLSRMIRNILANAVRHTQGDILLGARKRGNMIRIEIWDQGQGIANADQEHVFTEFFQINNPERDRSKGLGLGLAIVKRLSTLLNHPIALHSFEGKGLCFCIDVPAAQHHVTNTSTSIHHDMVDIDCFVLVIDDEKDIRRSLQMLLRGWGCEVLIADSAQAAINEMKRDNYPAPDIIISDYRLREGKLGTDAAQAVSQLFKQSIPTLIITGDTNPDIANTCSSLGYTLLHKPLSSEDLQRALKKLLINQPT